MNYYRDRLPRPKINQRQVIAHYARLLHTKKYHSAAKKKKLFDLLPYSEIMVILNKEYFFDNSLKIYSSQV